MMQPPALPRALATELERSARRPEEARRWAERMVAAQQADDQAEIYRTAIRAKQAAPRSPRIREALGLAAFSMGKWREAAQELLAYRRLTGHYRHDPTIAECYRREGRPGRSLEFLSSLRRTDVDAPTWVRAQTVKARALADNGRPDVATSVLESLRIERPQGPAEEEALAVLDELR